MVLYCGLIQWNIHTMKILETAIGFCIRHANHLIECEQLHCISYFLSYMFYYEFLYT